jgi:Recombination endonuclease VII
VKKKHAKKALVKVSPRDARLKRLYNLDPGDYEKVLEFQGGVCFICGLPPKEGKNLHVDHCHKTGLTRGLLCWKDNAAVGKFNDDSTRVHRAWLYLMGPPVTEALGRQVFGRTGRITNKRKRRKRSKK